MTTDRRPKDCHFRQKDEQRPYPRSSCRACGKGIMSGLGNKCAEYEPIPVMWRARLKGSNNWDFYNEFPTVIEYWTNWEIEPLFTEPVKSREMRAALKILTDVLNAKESTIMLLNSRIAELEMSLTKAQKLSHNDRYAAIVERATKGTK